MSAHHNLRLHSPSKVVFNKPGDIYQAYCKTYKTQTMATHHGEAGPSLDRDDTPHGKDTEAHIPHDYDHEDTGDIATIGQEHHNKLANLTQELGDLCHRVLVGEGQSTEALNHIECKHQRLSIVLHPSALCEPLDDVLQQYTETLCSAQKWTTFMDTLIQDIPTFNDSNSTQLEDWLVDTETAANLIDESRTKLTQAKSKGLTHTLITEALASGMCWEGIKDLLHLKLCNSDIHTSVSRFMEIQQEKESLAAYIHHFKREAKRCNFTNSAATIKIFVKGLKNTHTLATRVYEKGPQTLADTISKVENLQAAQQLTATLLPSSTVNVMSHEEDQCYQCQELGHIAHHCPNVHCFE